MAINAALARAAAEHGGVVLLPAGTCVIGGTIFIPESAPVTLAGEGPGVTTIQLANGVNRTAITHRSFVRLTGSGRLNGLFRATLRDFTVDGNKDRQTTASACIELYGHALTLQNLIVQNCRGDGIWSEWGVDSDFQGPDADLESRFADIKTMFNRGNGFVFRGPHDSYVNGLISWRNHGWGMVTETTAANRSDLRVAKVNTYLNDAGGIKAGGGLIGEDVAGTTVEGWGMLIERDAGAVDIVNGTFSGPVALEIRNTNNMIQGMIVNSTIAGLYLNGGGSSTLVLGFFGNSSPLLRFRNPSGPSIIVGTGTSVSGFGFFDGNPRPDDTISLHMAGLVQREFNQMPPMALDNKEATFQSLGAPHGPEVRWCSDCKTESSCAPGGNGAWAFSSGSDWKCPF